MILSGAFSITNRTRRSAPRAPFARAAKAVLPSWEISLAFVGKTRAQRLNETLRGKSYVPNVLSYAVGERSGEVIICLDEARRQAGAYGLSTTDFILYLFIHGLLHLNGGAHGATMERRERALLARIAKASRRDPLNVPPNRNRNRYRHAPGEAGRRRRTRG